MVFYYVHPAVLYINKFRVAGLLEDGIDQYNEQVGAQRQRVRASQRAATGAGQPHAQRVPRRASQARAAVLTRPARRARPTNAAV
jgi:hypothetical protein